MTRRPHALCFLALLLCSVACSAKPLPEFVFANYTFSDDADPAVGDLISRAAHLSYPEPEQSRQLVIEALQKAHDGAALSDYTYSYALYLLLKNGFDGPGSSTFGPGTRDDYLRVARHLIGHLERGGKVGQWIFTDQGQFYIEAYITAGNGLAWYLYEGAAGDPDTLEAALVIAQRASGHASSEQHYYVRDTEVRILLALGRHDEAYGIVRDVLEEVPSFGDFADLQQDPAYRQWRDAQ